MEFRAGEWTNDTSLALCLATSLLEMDGFDARDQMERYWRWYKEGYLSSNGRCFDIGSTTSAALHRFRETGNPFAGSEQARQSGNGSIMRLAPIPLFYYPDDRATLKYSAESSRTTHASPECVDAARLLGNVLHRCLAGASKKEVLGGSSEMILTSIAIKALATGSFLDKSEREIRGSGYVVDSLEAALWCFWQTQSFEAAILRAVNLGDDADTTAAVCGQVAGAFYGDEAIPPSWLGALAMRAEIMQFCRPSNGT